MTALIEGLPSHVVDGRTRAEQVGVCAGGSAAAASSAAAAGRDSAAAAAAAAGKTVPWLSQAL